MKFYYIDGNRKVYLTLRRGSFRWANLDCPNIYIEGDPTRPGLWRLMTGLWLEDGNSDLKDMARNFVKLSGEAFYKEFPSLNTGRTGNGFLQNFDSHLRSVL